MDPVVGLDLRVGMQLVHSLTTNSAGLANENSLLLRHQKISEVRDLQLNPVMTTTD